MSGISYPKNQYIAIGALTTAILFLYAQVITKLVQDWWTDENYSHGLLVPIVVAFIVWTSWELLKGAVGPGSVRIGSALFVAAVLLLLIGTLGAELFTQRISFVLMAAAVVVYLWGFRLLNLVAVPFILLLLSIPIPQIVFNRIAFPLQIWASQLAVVGIRLFGVPTVRMGNVIDILPAGATQTLSLEVVEACSGIRSLMTLVTLALVLSYFTRHDQRGRIVGLSGPDAARALLLMSFAVIVAVFTNALRVTATGVLTYYYGKQATEASWHDTLGWIVYVLALALLLGANYLLKRLLHRKQSLKGFDDVPIPPSFPRVWPVLIAILLAGVLVNWLALRPETTIPRKSFSEMGATLGSWQQRGDSIKFDDRIQSLLKTTDYTMREYVAPDGRIANIYVGYYGSQRTGATYHSPQNCLPGAGWVMNRPQYIDIITGDGRVFRANQYFIENGIYNEVMIYWYQGRGRSEANEYADKLNTIWDSVTRGRTDGALVRVMTSVGNDEAAALRAAVELSTQLADSLSPFVPE
ncbi:MAG: exosortase C-terminal domain/associated protein EpsI [Pyrinomonadaceae bacterium]